MHVTVVLEKRFVAVGGDLYTDSVTDYRFWQRYLEVFDRVTIAARINQVDRIPSGWLKANGPGVDYRGLPYFVGLGGFVRQAWRLWREVRKSVRSDGAFILRVPGILGSLAALELDRLKKPYALEVVGDPNDSLSPQVWRNPVVRLARLVAVWLLRRECRRAKAGLSYVTREALQRSYPPGNPAERVWHISTGIKDFGLLRAKMGLGGSNGAGRETGQLSGRSRALVFVGTLASLYKAPHILIEAVSICRSQGWMVTLTIVGDGRYRGDLESLVRQKGLADAVCFRGHVSRAEDVCAELCAADLFVLPSFQEGLPRAMLEAMSAGVPCIGSTVGGIPEILEQEDMVPPGDAPALAAKIMEVLDDPARRERMRTKGLAVSAEFLPQVLEPRRREFYAQVLERTEAYRKRGTIEGAAQ